jgi:hypothetical protein
MATQSTGGSKRGLASASKKTRQEVARAGGLARGRQRKQHS